MELIEIMQQNNFVVVGNTLDNEKYAAKIKQGLLDSSYNVRGVHKELSSINDVDFDIDIIDLCINPILGLKYIKECTKSFKTVVIQPGAESDELTSYLKENNIDYIEGCLLVGLKLYSKNK